jgi:hypothetical protein
MIAVNPRTHDELDTVRERCIWVIYNVHPRLYLRQDSRGRAGATGGAFEKSSLQSGKRGATHPVRLRSFHNKGCRRKRGQLANQKFHPRQVEGHRAYLSLWNLRVDC